MFFSAIPLSIPRTRNWLMMLFACFLLRIAGWRIKGTFPDCSRFIAIIAPHTSNWDFVLVVTVKLAMRVKVSWFGKHTIFRPPFGWIFRWMGGIPIERSSHHGTVGQITEVFRRSPVLVLALSPEGTRKGPSIWKTGFYRIAMGAEVPILPVGLDYARREIKFLPLCQPTGDQERDMVFLKSLYNDMKGKRPRMKAS